MTLEQRIEALETEVAKLHKQLSDTVEALSCFESQVAANFEQIIKAIPA